jgi:hypothetical protein
MATTSTQSKQSRSALTPDDSHRLAQRMRPATAPAYYQGRPAWKWLAAFNRTRPHA